VLYVGSNKFQKNVSVILINFVRN